VQNKCALLLIASGLLVGDSATARVVVGL